MIPKSNPDAIASDGSLHLAWRQVNGIECGVFVPAVAQEILLRGWKLGEKGQRMLTFGLAN
jgi:hypothetical protein